MKSILLKVVVFVSVFIACGHFSNGQMRSDEMIIDEIFIDSGEKYFSTKVTDKSLIQDLSRIISVDKVKADGMVYAYANRKEFASFLEMDLPYQILPHPGRYEGRLNMKDKVDIRNIEAWDFYPTYDAYIDMMNQFAEVYPDICELELIGNSTQGRQLLALKISDNIGIKENEPQFLYTSSIHGDETTGYVLMLRLIDYLLTNYGTDSRVTNMVNNMEIWINPLANPDGTYHGGNNTVNGAIRYNSNWVDINRNFRDPEDGPHPDGNAWQQETVHFMALAEANHFVSSANLHGGESVCNYPWDTWPRLAADDDWWQYVCHEYADTVHANCPFGYMTDFDNGITNGYQWYTISGGRQDYMNYFHQCREFTLEISNTKLMQPDSLPHYWNYNYRSLLNYLEQSMFGLRGTVRDSVSGWPVKAEVYVVLHEKDSSWVYTDMPHGNYHRLLAEGTYTVRYSASGYYPQIIQGVQVLNKQATVLDIELVPEGVGGIENNPLSRSIQIYPNPASGKVLNVKTDIDIKSISVYTLSGKEISDLQYDPFAQTILVDKLEAGMYFIQFDTEKGSLVRKFVVR
jgi:hypothetical protein